MLILVVEAGAGDGGGLARALAAEPGVEVEGVADALRALDRLAARPFDAVVTELDITPLDGVELVRRIRQHLPKLPLLILTSDATAGRAVASMRAGATDFVRRPVPAGALVALLRRALGQLQVRALRDPVEPVPSLHDGEALVFPPPRERLAAEEADGVVMPPGLTLEEVERRYLVAALGSFTGDYASLAARLGISRKTLWEKRRRLGLSAGREDTPTPRIA